MFLPILYIILVLFLVESPRSNDERGRIVNLNFEVKMK